MSTRKSVMTRDDSEERKGMNEEDIDSDSEIYFPSRNHKSGKGEHFLHFKVEEQSIKLTIRRSSSDNTLKVVLGPNNKSTNVDTPKSTTRPSRTRKIIYESLNENTIVSTKTKCDQTPKPKKKLDVSVLVETAPNGTPRSSHRQKKNKFESLNEDKIAIEQNECVQTPKTSKNSANRKRSAKTNRDTDNVFEEKYDSYVNEADENNMYIANSPSKRPKSHKDNLIHTPHKDKVQTSYMTPRTKLAQEFDLNLKIEKSSCKTPNKLNRTSSIKKNLDDTFCQQKNPSENILLREISSDNTKGYNLRNKPQFTTYNFEDDEPKTSGSEYESDGESESSDDENMSCADSNDSQSSKRQKIGKKNFTTPKKQFSKGISKTSKTPSAISKVTDTPTKAFSRLSLTPSVHQRTANIAKPSTPLQEARLKLHVSVLPKSLPCREEQFNDIYTFLHTRLADKSGGCIYISGVPGTGKTATVNEVIRCLKKAMTTGKLTEFDYIDVNGMKLSEPRQAYVQIWKQLEKDPPSKIITWEAAQKVLQERFTKPNPKRKMTLLLVDELDLLCTKRQDVVYNLLDWPSKIGAKLVVVTIANTMDLPERILMGKVTSRLGLTRLTFPPYNHRQLEEIVVSRLKGYDAFGGETIQLVARKVAAVSGDARRALDICRRATEIAESNDREVVSMMDVKKALDEMIASPKVQAIKHCSDYEKVFLQAVCTEVNRTGLEEVVFKNVYHQLETLCTFNGEKVPNVTEALDMCSRLGSWRLLLCDHSRMDIHQRLLLNVTTDDVHFATQTIETY